MNTDFATAMSRALAETRAMNPAAATATIQAALAAGQDGVPASSGTTAPRPPTRFSLIDPSADEAETLDEMTPKTTPDRTARAPDPRSEPKPEPTPRPPFSVLEPKADPAGGAIKPGFGAGLRRSLREVVDGLARGRPGGHSWMTTLPGMGGASAPIEVEEGARYESRAFSGPTGARDYRLYVPASLTDGPKGLVVMLHGCTQNPDDFVRGTGMNDVAEAHGLIVAYPAQTGAHNAQSCWNWFRPGDQRRDAGEPAIIAGITRTLSEEFDIDPGRVYVAGLSAGGAMAAVMGDAYPELFAAVGVHSGLPVGSATDVVSAFAAMRGDGVVAANGDAGVRTIVFHGGADTTVHPSNARRIVAANGSGTTVERGVSAGGRGYARTVRTGPDGATLSELWLIDGAGHAWSGGSSAGSYTDPTGPDASAEMVRFFLNAT